MSILNKDNRTVNVGTTCNGYGKTNSSNPLYPLGCSIFSSLRPLLFGYAEDDDGCLGL